jgi:hypothetical protein
LSFLLKANETFLAYSNMGFDSVFCDPGAMYLHLPRIHPLSAGAVYERERLCVKGKTVRRKGYAERLSEKVESSSAMV